MVVAINGGGQQGQFATGVKEPAAADQGKPLGASTSGGGVRGVGNFAERAEEMRSGAASRGKGFGFKPNPSIF